MRDNDAIILEGLYTKILKEEAVNITNIKLEEKESCLEVFKQAFTQYDFGEAKGFLERTVSWNESIKASIGNKIVGIYLVGNRPLSEAVKDEGATPKEDLTQYENRKGIEGIALAVLPEYQKTGIGKQLKNKIESMPYDFIYGLQYKSLGNLEHWKKSRRIVAQSDGKEAVFITLKDL